MRELREAAAVGAILAGIALVVWFGFLVTTWPDPDVLVDARTPPGRAARWSGHGVEFELNLCSHCPLYVVAGRGLMHGYEMPDRKMWLMLNWPALGAAAKPADRRGTSEVPLPAFVLAVIGQWLLVGIAARLAFVPLARRRPLAA